MKAYHEQLREQSEQLIVQRSTNHTYNPHFHINVELLIVRKGSTKITYNTNDYQLLDGMIAFFDSYDIHGYETNCQVDTDDCLLVIPLKFLDNFNKTRKSGKISSPIIYDPELCNNLINLIDSFLINQKDLTVQSAVINLILSSISTKLQITPEQDDTDRELIIKILEDVNKNFRKDATLKSVSTRLGYCTAHLSRTFHKYLKMSLPEYVNNLRLDYVEKHKHDKNVLITELIFDAGFKSIQSYYRNKHRLGK